MNAHTPFDANKDWSNPYCQNSSNDPMVDALLGNAYHVVRTVYCNLGNLKLLYDFLNQYGMVIGVQSEAELKAMTTSASYARLYGFDNTNKRVVTDYLYVDGDRTGVIPDDPTATGSWILVATTNSGGGEDTNGKTSPPYIPYTYNNGSAMGGETTIAVPVGTVGVPMIVVGGYTNLVGYGFTYDATTLTVTLAQALEPGDEVHLFLTGTPAVPDNPNVTDWVQINWLYNGGYASGGEQVIQIPYTFQSVPAIYKNGVRYYAGLAENSYTVDAANQRILLTEPLATNDRLIVTIGGESETLIMSDRTIQEVARSANVKDTEVILSTNTTQYLNGKKIIYDVVAQKLYGLPSLPTNVYISSISNGQLTYSPGNITVDLLEVPNSGASLREDLSKPDGSKLIGTCPNIAVLRTIEPTYAEQRIYVEAHTEGMIATNAGDLGGGYFVYKPSVTSADDNGMTIVTASGKCWVRDLRGSTEVTPSMFGAWMDAPYIDGSTIQGTPYPKAPSMGAADLSGVHNDGDALQATYSYAVANGLNIKITQPMYIGDTQIDISNARWTGRSLSIMGLGQRQSIIYTSGKGGFISTRWGHNITIGRLSFRNADSAYVGSPLIISAFDQNNGIGGGGKTFNVHDVDFYHYKFALPMACFVSVMTNLYAYDCTYGFGISGSTSTDMSSIWAHHCDIGFLWGAAINRTTYEPANNGTPVMYVATSNIAADGCTLPHKFYGDIRSLSFSGFGIEGINGPVALDFSQLASPAAQTTIVFRDVSCWIQSSMNTGVTHFIELPANEYQAGRIIFDSGYVNSDYVIKLMENSTSPSNQYIGRSVTLNSNFEFLKVSDGSYTISTYNRGNLYRGRVYGEDIVQGRNSYTGTTLSAIHSNSNSFFRSVDHKEATVLVPWNRALDIFLCAVGEETKIPDGCFIAGRADIIPVNKNGLAGTESGGSILFGLSGSTQENVATGAVWSNMIAGDKSLSGITVTKLVRDGKTFVRIALPTANLTNAIVHLSVTYCGFAHYYDKRWELKPLS